MNESTPPPPIATQFAEALSQRYLAYALSTITARSLPDVRDGLKPVHRRLLYAMRQLRLDPEQGYKKSARVVGDVMGKFHPHGDAAIYDAMVRLAQEFAMRYPLVDGQGNFGNIDGDNAAAMRYTEARMSPIAQLLLQGIDEDAVDFRATYDGESAEPVILPSAIPHLLANGAQGIAVGMATSIPPHNLTELFDASLHLLRHPNASIETLCGFIKGPDFPTGGVLVESPEAMLEAYRTGRGSFRLRAEWAVEKDKGGAWQIVVTAIPYQVQKSRLVEKMAEMLFQKKLPMLADLNDESAEDLRIVLEPKSRRLDPVLVMESLFRLTELESKISLNLNVLDASGKPGVLSLKAVLLAWTHHRLQVLQRRSRYRLSRIENRLEVLAGYLIVYLNLDAVIAIIRDDDEPKSALMVRFSLNERQANAILDMRLRSLRRLEEMQIRTEQTRLTGEQASLNVLLGDDTAQRHRLAQDIKEIKQQIGKSDSRKTRLDTIPEVAGDPLDMLVEKEPITVICSANGWIRAVKTHLAADAELRFKEGDSAALRTHAYTTDTLLLAADNGRFYTLDASRLPSGRGFGEPLSVMLELGVDTRIISIFPARSKPAPNVSSDAGAGGIISIFPAQDTPILLASQRGYGFITDSTQVIAQTRNGKQVLALGKGDKMAVAKPITGDAIAVVGDNRKLLVFPRTELPVMAKGKGVILQRYKSGGLADACGFVLDGGLSWIQGSGRIRTEKDTTPWCGKRATVGRSAPQGFPKPPKFNQP